MPFNSGRKSIDLDGVSIALDVFKHMVRKIKMNSIDGFSSLQVFKGAQSAGRKILRKIFAVF